jgi:hypothetical protein
MGTIEQTAGLMPATENEPSPDNTGRDTVADQLRAASTEDERASIVASCIGETVGKFSSLKLTELDIKNNPIYRRIKTKLDG